MKKIIMAVLTITGAISFADVTADAVCQQNQSEARTKAALVVQEAMLKIGGTAISKLYADNNVKIESIKTELNDINYHYGYVGISFTVNAGDKSLVADMRTRINIKTTGNLYVNQDFRGFPIKKYVTCRTQFSTEDSYTGIGLFNSATGSVVARVNPLGILEILETVFIQPL